MLPTVTAEDVNTSVISTISVTFQKLHQQILEQNVSDSDMTVVWCTRKHTPIQLTQALEAHSSAA